MALFSFQNGPERPTSESCGVCGPQTPQRTVCPKGGYPDDSNAVTVLAGVCAAGGVACLALAAWLARRGSGPSAELVWAADVERETRGKPAATLAKADELTELTAWSEEPHP